MLRIEIGKGYVARWVLRIASVVVFLGAWQLIGEQVNPILLVPPTAVAAKFATLWACDACRGGSLLSQTLITLETVLGGLALSMVIGVPIGMLMGRAKLVEYALDPYVTFIYSLPIVIIIPLAVIWFGSNLWPSTYLIVMLHAAPAILINTFIGVKAMERSLVETGKIFGARGEALWRKVILPGTVPYVLAGLRIGIGLAIIGTMVVEILLYNAGLGYELVYYQSIFDTGAVLAGVIMIMIIGVVARELVGILEKRYLNWKVGAAGVG